jgi:hypothetical protein
LLAGDELMLAALLSVLLVAVSTLCHYETLRWLNDRLPNMTLVESRAKVLLALIGAVLSHLCQIALFAATYYLLRDELGLGTLAGHFRDTLSSFLYFSAETYTTLGFGDIYPLGQICLVTGCEALTGLLMISWTASFTYLEMRRYWG